MIQPTAITAIVSDIEFKTIPNRLAAQDASWATTAWSEAAARLSLIGVDTYTWEMANYIALLFDTFEPYVDDVHLRWSRQDTFIQESVMINDCHVCIGWETTTETTNTMSVEIENNHELNDKLTRPPTREMLEALYTAAQDAPQPLIAHLDLLNGRFDRVTSAEQAHAIAASIDPRVIAEISRIGLVSCTDVPGSTHSRSHPRM